MKLEQLITEYINYRKSLGEKFKTNEKYLKAFCKSIEPSINIDSISEDMVNNFLYSSLQVITSGWFIKHTALLGFYRYALTRNYITKIPLPQTLPKRPQSFVPYIYSKEELKRLFDTALTYQKNKSYVEPYLVRTILILTYALGLRIHETLSIKLEDIDMTHHVITIRETKFYKSRLVPFSTQLTSVIVEYLDWRTHQKCFQDANAFAFIGKNNRPFNIETMRGIFVRIRKKANIKRVDNANYQPRMHDLRHTFAVNRLTSWYKENKNVQQLLPILSTYLGHTYLAHTTIYLTMTDDLLQEASMRFEQYATGGQI
ncbi:MULTISPECIES: tyrosine-type recombinase/integrase [unclassified Candidatus Tisiphia]|uniref:tyrosine-type recombinase/integrase n=1 Tax=unclassified Candidatus Tisiphia TaxID=2996318 RepID=UPI00312C6DB5